MAGTMPLISPTAVRMRTATIRVTGLIDEADVARFGVFGHGAVERKSADGEGNDVGQDDAEESADEGDGERLGQKLEEDVAAARAQRFLDADFAGALGDGDEHDVHQADAADAQREGADESRAESSGRE